MEESPLPGPGAALMAGVGVGGDLGATRSTGDATQAAAGAGRRRPAA